jgi:hypothetical protein
MLPMTPNAKLEMSSNPSSSHHNADSVAAVPRRDLDAAPGLEPPMADAIPIFGQYALAADVLGGKPLGVISYVLAGVSLVACAVLLVAGLPRAF